MFTVKGFFLPIKPKLSTGILLGFHRKSLRVSLESMVLTGLIRNPSPKPIGNQVFICHVKG